MAETVGFEPTGPLQAHKISNLGAYDHLRTSLDGYSQHKPDKGVSPGILFYLLMTSIEQVGLAEAERFELSVLADSCFLDKWFKPLTHTSILSC